MIGSKESKEEFRGWMAEAFPFEGLIFAREYRRVEGDVRVEGKRCCGNSFIMSSIYLTLM